MFLPDDEEVVLEIQLATRDILKMAEPDYVKTMLKVFSEPLSLF